MNIIISIIIIIKLLLLLLLFTIKERVYIVPVKVSRVYFTMMLKILKKPVYDN